MLDFLFGGSKTKQHATLSPEQIAAQNFLMGQMNDLGGMEMQSSYRGDIAGQNLRQIQRDYTRMANEAVRENRHHNRLHSSHQGIRTADIRNRFAADMNKLTYQHQTQQQDWMQAYAQKAKDWNYGGRYQMMAMLSQPALKNQFENVTEKTPGLFDVISGISGAAANITGMFGGSGGGGAPMASAARIPGLGG